MFIPVGFNLKRKGFLPILTITGITKPIPGIEKVMIMKALQAMEIAQRFRGKIMDMEETMADIPRGMTAVRINIIFENETDLEAAVSGIKKELR